MHVRGHMVAGVLGHVTHGRGRGRVELSRSGLRRRSCWGKPRGGVDTWRLVAWAVRHATSGLVSPGVAPPSSAALGVERVADCRAWDPHRCGPRLRDNRGGGVHLRGRPIVRRRRCRGAWCAERSLRFGRCGKNRAFWRWGVCSSLSTKVD
jgi:hypothetical protein